MSLSRVDDPLLCELDAELPQTLVVGEGNVLFLSGWCFHPSSRVATLRVVANGVAHPVAAIGLLRPDVFAAHFPGRDPRGLSYGSGFAATVSFTGAERATLVDLELQAALRDGTSRIHPLGSIRLVPTSDGEGLGPSGRSPRIAICMTTYNPPPDLFARQVQSIRDQTVGDWMCYICDDGSEPAAFDEIRRVVSEDARFRVFRGSTRLGFYHNFERCLRLVPAGVEYVALSDHDDKWHPDKLATLLAAFTAETTLVYSDMNIIDEHDRALANTYWTTRPNRYDSLASLLIANTITGAASMFRASLLRRLLPFPQKIGEPFHDHWLACLALSTGRVGYVNRPLYDYVQHSSNVLGHFAPARAGLWARVQETLRSLTPRRARAALGAWRKIYYGEVQRLRLIARLLQMRCGEVTPEKAGVLRRLARLDESWGTTLWLAFRAMRGLGRVTETIGGELTLLRGLLWRLYAQARSRLAPRRLAGD